MRIGTGEISARIKAQLENYEKRVLGENVGAVLSVSDGIARIYGLERCMSNEMLRFENGAIGLALNLEEHSVAAAVLGDAEEIGAGSTVKASGELLSVAVGEGLQGRVVDALGNPIDEKGRIDCTERYPIEGNAPTIMQRARVSRPLETGVKAIDSMIPIGKGQRELIIGDRQSGKTAIAVDTILHQRDKNVVCVYAAIGQKQSFVADLAQTLEAADAMRYTILLSAPASDTPAMQYIAPYAACAMAEYFMHRGRDVLIVYDDLSKHAAAYRALSLLLRRPSGREAYPGDVFYLHSRLLERTARRSEEAGGGSITALPIVETLSGDVSAYIPTNVISITDGQIFLESELFRSGIRPAVNAGISVSRVGGSAQIPAMRKLSGKLRMMYSQYQELKTFAQFGTESDESTRLRLAQGERIVEIFKQRNGHAVPIEKQVALLFALLNGNLNEIEAKRIATYEAGLYRYLDAHCALLMEHIRTSGELTHETEAELSRALADYGEAFAAEEGAERHAR